MKTKVLWGFFIVVSSLWLMLICVNLRKICFMHPRKITIIIVKGNMKMFSLMEFGSPFSYNSFRKKISDISRGNQMTG